jgi:predicted transcriptional regulator
MSRTKYATSLDEDLLHKLRILAAQENKKMNDMLEEAIMILLRKYEKIQQAREKLQSPNL